jgi:hypothetical protein
MTGLILEAHHSMQALAGHLIPSKSQLRPQAFSSLAKLLYNNSIKQGTLPQSSNQQLSRKINFAETQTSTFFRNHPISRYDKL